MPKLFKSLIIVAFAMSLLAACTSSPITPVESETIVVTDVRGEVTIPLNPQRIVDLSGNSDMLSILGYSVVGTANSDAYDYTKLPRYLENTLSGSKILGYAYQDTMDIEAIMNLNPDLIIISTIQEKMVDMLSKIAPTVMIKMEALDWQADLRTLGTLFQRTEQTETWLNTYASKAGNNGSILRGLLGTETSYLSFLASGGQYYVFDGAGFGTVLYTDLGLARPQGLPSQTDVSLPVVSMEGLASIKADWFFVLGTDADNEALMNNPLWMSLPAVKAERVLYLPASPYFTQGYSAIGRELLLDEIVDLLSNEAGS